MKEGCHQKLEPVSVYKCHANIALYNLMSSLFIISAIDKPYRSFFFIQNFPFFM